MNLFDFIKRKDRGLEVEAGICQAEISPYLGQQRRCVFFSDGARVHLKGANEFYVLNTRPSSLLWQGRLKSKGGLFGKKQGRISIALLNEGKKTPLSVVDLTSDKNTIVEFKWPAVLSNYDILIEAQ